MERPVLDKVYNPLEVESRWYGYWMDHRLFHGDPKSPKPKYTVMIPPPNVTGMLTMGHILNNTLQDLLVRWKRMDGFESLWMPGTDHAGIATQNKVESALKAEGLTRHDLGREKLIERVWEWKEKYGGIILRQLRKLGASCDWERERFTMDEGLSRAVREVFVRLHEKKLIYRGRRLINWCPRCQTALADEEAPSTDVDGRFWTLAYPLEGSGETITVSTTRPETMLGDTAVAVHPDDPRYAALVGRTVILPLTDRRIPIVADAYADPEKGSGAVKITPAHDFNDFEVARRHGLVAISVIDDRGVMNENAGPYRGLDRFEARKRILADLAGRGLLLSDEPRVTPIPHCYRCNTIVEPFLSDQWFVRMQPLAEPALAAVEQGRIRFHPKQWEETYFHWMRNIRDWCISRQVWWGHRIPVWTCENGHATAHRTDPTACPECGSRRLEQDPDVLDTWFSSWLWPFSTLGWPESTDDLKAFFPTDSLVTGPDIIFFWVARMIMASIEFTGEVPFRDVYFNGMIRDLSGRKMSKSLGNSPDPLWLIDGADAKTVGEFAKHNPSYKAGVPAYGADAIRLTMVYQTPLGGDVHFDHPLVEMGQKFANKLWNASRFVMMNLDESRVLEAPAKRAGSGRADLADRWIMSRLNNAAGEIRSALEQFRFNEAAQAYYRFVWSEFCDWYLELAKPRLYAKEDPGAQDAARATALYALESILRLGHPFMPFITEAIWQALPVPAEPAPAVHTILNRPYPKEDPSLRDDEAEAAIALVQEAVGAVRNIRSGMNVPPERKAKLIVRGNGAKCRLLSDHAVWFDKLANVESVTVQSGGEKPEGAASGLAGDVELFLPLGGLIDLAVERERLSKEIGRMEGLLKGLEGKLSNADFVARAPKEVVEKEKQKKADFEAKLETLRLQLKTLG
jgi:valyl-tRNA synthetase